MSYQKKRNTFVDFRYYIVMRITGGEYKGLQIKVPSGKFIRPMTDKVREAVFTILENRGVFFGTVLDLYAGSGAIGIEALSRGAEWVDFVDQNRKSCGIIKENLERLKIEDKAHVYCYHTAKAITFLTREYDVILLDPPYADASMDNLLSYLVTLKITDMVSAVMLHHANRFTLKESYSHLHLTQKRRYGDSYISIYQRED